MPVYPAWTYFPKSEPPPDWVHILMSIVAAHQPVVTGST